MRKNYCIYIFIFSIVLLNVLIICSSFTSKANQDNYFRLHIVANSNSIDDQIIKLNVSKKVTNYLDSLLKSNNAIDKDSSKEIIKQNITNILEVANNELKINNVNYMAYANIGKISYEEKHSDVINMDKGTYDSVQVVLGEGEGENFWSLIFPYSYTSKLNKIDSNNLNEYTENDEIEIKSGILEDIKKVVKLFS